MTRKTPIGPAVFAVLAIVSVIALVLVSASEPERKPTQPAERPLVTVEPPVRDLGVTMDYSRSPNVIVTTPGTEAGLPDARVFRVVRFSIDGKLIKVRSAPPYTITNLPSGPHILTVTGTATGGDNSRIQESYVK